MSGEPWREKIQIGKETVYGTPVAATRTAYLTTLGLTAPPEIRPRRYNVGQRANVLSAGIGPSAAQGPATLPVNADELVEWGLLGFQGGVTPTTPVGATEARLWSFVTGLTLDSATVERFDGARYSQWNGIQVNEFTVEGSAAQGNTTNLGLMALAVDDTFAALTTLSDARVPDDMEGWQTVFYLDALGATPGTTQITDALISWRLRMNNNMQRKKFADGTRSFNKLTLGVLDLTAELRLEASSASMGTILAAANANTPQLLRFEFQGPADGIEAGYRKFVRLDIPGIWGAVDRAQESAGSREYGMPLQFIYDATNGFGVRLQLQNARTTAW